MKQKKMTNTQRISRIESVLTQVYVSQKLVQEELGKIQEKLKGYRDEEE
jgi:hypothetical protein